MLELLDSFYSIPSHWRTGLWFGMVVLEVRKVESKINDEELTTSSQNSPGSFRHPKQPVPQKQHGWAVEKNMVYVLFQVSYT